VTGPGPVWARQVPDAALAWVQEACGSRVHSVRPLPSAFVANHAVVLDGGQELLLRRWARPGWAEGDPDLSAHREALVLGRLADAPVPVPALVAADPDGERSDAPALLLTLLPGRPPDGPPDLDQLLTALDAVHAVDPEGIPPFARYHDPAGLSVPAWAQERGVWELATAVARRDEPELPDRLIHRDPHPGNTLWVERRLTGIVDWTTGSRGPAAVDLAHLRVNLALAHGIAASGAVLPHPERHPYWDIAITLDFAPELDAPTPLEVARLEAHLSSALADLIG
jgi:aminoglycoside phosphotransferase (APT) family kinase protein